MKGEQLFASLTNIREEYIAEAAIPPMGGSVRREGARRRRATLLEALNSGWGVASICLVVGLAAIIGMVAWGRMGAAGPQIPGFLPETGVSGESFTFSYEMTPAGGQVAPGGMVTLNTTLVNRGEPFTYEGASSEFCAYARFIWRGDDSVVLHGSIAHTTDIGEFTVASGQVGGGYYVFHIPEDTPTGAYDLELSYGGCKQVYEGVLIVGEVSTRFTMSYSEVGFSEGYTLWSIRAWVINNGSAFTLVGASNAYKPDAKLVHRESGYIIEGITIFTNDYQEMTISEGQIGTGDYNFRIGDGAPGGYYDLHLTFEGETCTIPNALLVTPYTDELPSPPITDAMRFSFGYSLGTRPNRIDRDDVLCFDAWVVNEGETFTYTGDPFAFIPSVSLWYMEDPSYTIQGLPPATGMPPQLCTVESGKRGRTSYEFRIPADAPAGSYGLVLSYGSVFQYYKDVLTLIDDELPSDDILDAYYAANRYATDVRVIHDYGTFGDGVRVALILDSDLLYTQAFETHHVGPAVIKYSNGNFLQALHRGVFYSLSEAYELGLLSDADLAAIENLHREFYPSLYADDE